ncbi:protein of unknown function DUF1549 [Fibrisoma limi BUZ 3]|uniref:LamG-like jellyroll fold domain-containing protein n=1 Tax=Fibrisoma limi BUZ 3 TaxID=1185876 RepID=I2GK61_9BACT|nr:DUF1553 domain-containing protein [Fibrisoma limi]CCH54286.1 protein of unknown function DUF1549 [Fibrisoma limi BUZ 3]
MLRNVLFFLTTACLPFGGWLLPTGGDGVKRPADGVRLPAEVAAAYEKLPAQLDYNLHVKPILSDKCFACHGPDKAKQKAGLRLDVAQAAYGPLPENPGKVAIKPGNWAKSEVVLRVLSSDPDYLMPTPASHLTLTATEKATLLKWIKDGAVYKPHWAFVRPEKKPVPVSEPTGVFMPVNEIDHFVLSRLKQEGLSPSPEAPKDLLLRRLSLDLTGLPPTPAELDAFLADQSPDAYEKQVDRLLASPHYGEKMATDWLDLARFADSHGYTVDRLRDMSPYRDWVIRAFNQNMPYRTFIHQQLAGDLMKSTDDGPTTRDRLIATAFNRLHQQNMEGGIVEEEFQTEYVMDRTNTLGDAFLAISLGCARCHDHKYDPISQKNYYELFSFFNNVREAGQISWNDDLPTPTLLLPTEKQEALLRFMKSAVTEQEQTLSQALEKAKPAAETWIGSKAYQQLAGQTMPQAGLQGYFSFEDSLRNSVEPKQKGSMKRDAGEGTKPVFEKIARGQVLTLDGDAYADLNGVGVFRQSEPFTVGLWAWFPKNFKEGVIFHKGNAERLYNFKGYHLMLKGNRLEVSLAHTAPANAITRQSSATIPRETWVQLTMTYDGSSKANGLRLYLNGAELPLETVVDQLYKDIIFYDKKEPALQIGGWWRGLGFKGGKVDDVVVYNRTLTPFEIRILAGKAGWASLASKASHELTAAEKEMLSAYYASVEDADVTAARLELRKRRTALSDSTRHIAEIMVMQEMPTPKTTHLLQRGQYDMPGPVVSPNTPGSILPFPANLPKNRLGLAQWLTDERNPLTARVAVNRYWQTIFGTGLVKTAEDFGNQGEAPSHPELLDWLAVTFQQELDWDVKRLVKRMVMSVTYRQDSRTSATLRERDPENRLLARGPTLRLSAEMIRDNALLASGLLNPAIGGKSIKPYQPEGLWEINSMTYKPDSTDAIYRRSLYIIVKRSVPNPTLATFDAPARSSCIVRRQRTSTPLQALVTLNDPTFVEAARVLGEQMARQPDTRSAIRDAYRRLTSRTPPDRELALLVRLHQVEYEKFKANTAKAAGWLNAGLRKPDATLDPALVAAHAVVASTIMNSDATLTKR